MAEIASPLSPEHSRRALDRRLLAAHAAGDETALLSLYTAARQLYEAEGSHDAACFFGVQAYVMALATGSERAGQLRAWLVERGRER